MYSCFILPVRNMDTKSVHPHGFGSILPHPPDNPRPGECRATPLRCHRSKLPPMRKDPTGEQGTSATTPQIRVKPSNCCVSVKNNESFILKIITRVFRETEERGHTAVSFHTTPYCSTWCNMSLRIHYI